MKNIFYVVISILCLNGMIQAQTKGLKIGEKMPHLKSLKWVNANPEQKIEADIVVYDFFDTFCSTCIASMPKLKAIQDKLGKNIQIIMVTWQDQKIIDHFYANNEFLKENNAFLPTIIEDTQIKNLFPHSAVPHVVIAKNNRVKAITFGDFITESNLVSLLENKEIRVSLKDDFMEFNNDIKKDSLNLIGSVILQKYSDEWPQWEGIRETNNSNGMINIRLSNIGILSAYKALYARVKKPEYLLGKDRVIWENVDQEKLEYTEGTGGMQEWLSRNGICYERNMELAIDSISLAKAILSDLDHFLGIRVYWDKRTIPCLILQKDESSLMEDQDTNSNSQKLEGTGVLAFLIDYSGLFPPVFDAVNSKAVITLGDFSNLNDLNRQLANSGLKLVEGSREMEVLVVSKR